MSGCGVALTEFREVFPSFVSAVHNAKAYYESVSGQPIPKPELGQRTLSLFQHFNEEVRDLIPEFDPLVRCPDRHKLLWHIDQTIYCLFLDPYWNAMDSYDQNLLLWAGLLHDISKRVYSYGKKDPFHPFASGATALRVLKRFGWVRNGSDIDVKNTFDLILYSFTMKMGVRIHDNSRIPEILSRLLWHFAFLSSHKSPFSSLSETLGGSVSREQTFGFEIIALVLFHQSFTVLAFAESEAPLTPGEVGRFLTLRIAQMLRVLALCDSSAYTHLYAEICAANYEEINGNMKGVIQILELISTQ
jgi:hypothetical protein